MIKKLLLVASGAALAAVSFIAFSVVANAQNVAVSSSAVVNPIVVVNPISPGGPICPVFSRSLSIGATGIEVTQLQAYLNAHGYLTVSPTGYFGPLTQSAVARWQATGGVVGLGVSGSGIFGPLSRAYFSRSCAPIGGNPGAGSGSTSTMQNALNFSATPNLGLAPLTVQFVTTAPQNSTITLGNSVNFGDGTSGNLGYVPVCSNCNAEAVVSHTYTAPGTYTATLTSGTCSCPANGVCNCPAMIIIATTTVTVTGSENSSSTTSSGASGFISQQLDEPGSVTLTIGSIAEIRNASLYFKLASITTSAATIDTTPVGCWNYFPSDPPPAIRCMIAVVPTPPQTLSVGQAYTFGNYGITLTNLTSSTATFSVQ